MPASPLKKEDISLPGFGSFPDKIDLKNYTVRYGKYSLDDAGDVTLLEDIETKAIQDNQDIVLLVKDKFVFNEKYFIVITYLEKKPE
jgi:hypothetical protein